jgi:phosphoglycerol transferase
MLFIHAQLQKRNIKVCVFNASILFAAGIMYTATVIDLPQYLFGTIVITFGLTAIPYSVYYILAAHRRKRTLCHIRQYMKTAVFFSLLCLSLFSLYKFISPVNALRYLRNFNIKFIVVSWLISATMLLIHAQLKKRNIVVTCEIRRIPKHVIVALWVFLMLVFMSMAYTQIYGIIPIEQFIYHLAQPMTGANFSIVKQLFVKPWWINVLLVLISSLYILSAKIYINKHTVFVPFSEHRKVCIFIAMILFVAGIMYTTTVIGLPQYLLLRTIEKPSTFYEEHYISPDDAGITFPEKKRNLIVLIIESLETGFLTVENGGTFAEDLIPEIAELAKNHINFSGNDGIGGATPLYGTEWTMAGIASYYSGVPLGIVFLNEMGRHNSYGLWKDAFLQGASSIGDILRDAGYESYFFLGSDIAFAGRDKYFKTHKDTVIFDYNYFRENNYIPKDYNVWWGIEDRKLYRFAKDMILDIARKEPFFITLLTVDTHPVDGYLDEEAEVVFDSYYKNVWRDASKHLSAFVEWLQEQDFYENTTVVILGDHIYGYVDSSVFPEGSTYKESAYNKAPLNIFINSRLNSNMAKGRSFSHFDMFPLLIESIGGTYTKEGLGLGRSLQSESGETLVEKYGRAAMNEELKRKSKRYNTLWTENKHGNT